MSDYIRIHTKNKDSADNLCLNTGTHTECVTLQSLDPHVITYFISGLKYCYIKGKPHNNDWIEVVW
jgi:hypothetical protein